MPFRLAAVGANLDGFSGIPRHLIAALRRNVEVVEHRLPAYRPPLAKRLLVRLQRQVGKTYLWEKDPARCRFHSQAIDTFTASSEPDAVLVFGSESCAFTRTAAPLFGFGDSIFGSRLDLYEDQVSGRLARRSLEEGVEVQQRALDRIETFFITSRFAWERALSHFHYRTEADRVEVTLAGANLPHLETAPPPSQAGPEQFLWLGVDWKRKGGDFAVEVVRHLRSRGRDATLEVVGPVPISPNDSWVRFHGPLSGLEGLGPRFRESVALLLPTQADLTPIVIAEAAMHARPAIVPPVGGIPEMIDATSGLIVDSADPRQWAERIEAAAQQDGLRERGEAARAAYEDRLNWTSIAARLSERITAEVARRHRSGGLARPRESYEPQARLPR